mmetsp:Transcript_59194/g.158387  ORF Transcript_59194/g.158387 Transcript_59194/m.158387 type:complete len:350 (+) Transcript_59194:169-1218(+)
MVQVRLASKKWVYEFGDQPRSLFCILKGSVSLVAVPSATGGIHQTQTALSGIFRVPASSGAGVEPPSKVPDKQSSRLGSMFGHSPGNKNLKEASGTPEHADSRGAQQHHFMSPYMLFSHNTYVGDYEVIHGSSRMTNARCERDVSALELPRHAFVMLSSEFPQFFYHLGRIADRRERVRKERLRLLVQSQTAATLAALSIQRVAVARFGFGRGSQAGTKEITLELPPREEVAIARRPPPKGEDGGAMTGRKWLYKNRLAQSRELLTDEESKDPPHWATELRGMVAELHEENTATRQYVAALESKIANVESTQGDLRSHITKTSDKLEQMMHEMYFFITAAETSKSGGGT